MAPPVRPVAPTIRTLGLVIFTRQRSGLGGSQEAFEFVDFVSQPFEKLTHSYTRGWSY